MSRHALDAVDCQRRSAYPISCMLLCSFFRRSDLSWLYKDKHYSTGMWPSWAVNWLRSHITVLLQPHLSERRVQSTFRGRHLLRYQRQFCKEIAAWKILFSFSAVVIPVEMMDVFLSHAESSVPKTFKPFKDDVSQEDPTSIEMEMVILTMPIE